MQHRPSSIAMEPTSLSRSAGTQRFGDVIGAAQFLQAMFEQR
jgi:hypothetical protein